MIAYTRVEKLLQLLPVRPQPLLLRYGAAAILVLLFFIFHLGVGPAAGEYGFIVYIPPILLTSILFDRGSGFFATALSVILLGSGLDWAGDLAHHLSALTLFVVVAAFIVIVGEGMRTAWEREVRAQQAAELLLEEQDHRIKNELGIASSLITLQAKAQSMMKCEVRSSRLSLASMFLRKVTITCASGLVTTSPTCRNIWASCADNSATHYVERDRSLSR